VAIESPAPTRCPGCRALVPRDAGVDANPSFGSAPGCWLRFTEILAKEFGDIRYGSVHQLTVDAYAVQHPGLPARRTAQSVAVHLVGLCLALERGRSAMELPYLRKCFVEARRPFPWLEPPPDMGELTVNDVVAASTPEEHRTLVDRWARSAWGAWSRHHAHVRAWADEVP
jgi:hypothetical protein